MKPVFLTALLLLSSLTASLAVASEPTTLGWLERVSIAEGQVIMLAKIDTGADHSSINASNIRMIERDGRTWVRFALQDREGRLAQMERPLLRKAKIKRKEGGFIERPVVNLNLCLAGQRIDAVVNLANRGHFKYQLLIGRSLMAQRFLVDPGRTYITDPQCPTSTP